MAPQHSIMPEWVHAIGFGNILWVLFLGRFLIPWDALGLGAESDAAVRYGFLWQASTFTIGAPNSSIAAGQPARPRSALAHACRSR